MLYLADPEKRSFKFGLPLIWWEDEDTDFFMADNEFLKAMDERTQSEIKFFEYLEFVFEKWSRGESFQFTRVEDLPLFLPLPGITAIGRQT